MRPAPAVEVIANDRVTDEELWLMLLSTIRYSLGRRSYIVGAACEMVLKFRKRLRPEQVLQIVGEVQTEIERYENQGKTVGMDIDHARWKRLVQDLTQ